MAEVSRAKKRKFNRKTKKNWRNVNISEVEDFLEGERLQERTGGLVSEKPDESLFFLDKDKQSEAVEETPSKGLRRQPKPLKCHASLLPDPVIKPAKIARNIKPESKKKSARILERQQKGQISAILNSLAQRKKTQNDKDQARLERDKFNTNYDLWSDNKPESTDDLHYLTVTKKRRVKIPKCYNEKTSNVSAVQVPHPGASYNPTYEDYQELLCVASAIEEKKMKAEKKIHRALDAQFPSRDEAPSEETWLREMSAGLNDNEIKMSEADQEKDDRLSANPPVRRENFKTRKQRKTQMKLRQEEKNRMKIKSEKLRTNKVLRLKSLKKEILQEERLKRANCVRKEYLKNKFSDKPKKFGKLKYEEPELELKLTNELVDSLRLLKPEGHLLTDRFKSLQKRNMLVPRERATIKKKYKRKVYEKRSHRDVTVD